MVWEGEHKNMSKPHGHYCRICGQRKANEKFGRCGHAAHICKTCAKRGNKPPEVTPESPESTA